jgi:hypothetical protein
MHFSLFCTIYSRNYSTHKLIKLMKSETTSKKMKRSWMPGDVGGGGMAGGGGPSNVYTCK